MGGGAAAGSAAAAAAAAEALRRAREEEEEMTPYGEQDLAGWEFKILRSATGAFKKPDELRACLEEEARSGWELVEKFDDTRLRVKRKIECRERDRDAEHDPYRTYVGVTPNQMGLRILLGILGVLALIGIVAAVIVNR